MDTLAPLFFLKETLLNQIFKQHQRILRISMSIKTSQCVCICVGVCAYVSVCVCVEKWHKRKYLKRLHFLKMNT